jgi:hypothetical protein
VTRGNSKKLSNRSIFTQALTKMAIFAWFLNKTGPEGPVFALS